MTEPIYTGTLKPPSPGSPALSFEIADAWGWVMRAYWTGGQGTDVRLKDAACRRWEADTSDPQDERFVDLSAEPQPYLICPPWHRPPES